MSIIEINCCHLIVSRINGEIAMKKWIKQNSPWLITALCTLISLVLWIVFQNHPNLTSLFINLTAGFFVSTFTICIIDRILKKQRERDIKPLQRALYRDVMQFKHEIVNLWGEMYSQSIENRESIPIDQLFTKSVMHDILCHLDLEGNPNIIPTRDWFQQTKIVYDELQSKGDKILERYNTIAPPEILQTIHYLINNSVFAGKPLKYISNVKQVDIRNHIPRTPVLSSYLPEPFELDFSEIHNLLLWCKEYGNRLNGNKDNTIEKVSIINPNIPPSSIISAEKIANYSLAYQKWVESKPTIK